MTDAHYKHIQDLIRREVGGRIESSVWFALALAAISVAVTIWIAVLSANITNAAHRGMLEVGAWCVLAFGLFTLGVHFFGARRNCTQRAKDLIDTMDRYNIEVAQRQPAQQSSAGPVVARQAPPAEPVWPAQVFPFGSGQ